MKLLELLMEANNVESLDKPDTVAELQETVATLQQENQEMQEQNNMLLECLLEMSEIVYA